VPYGVDWLHPIDLTQYVTGQRHFWIRVAYDSDLAHGKGPIPTLIIERMRLEREVRGAGSLRKWRNGKNNLRVNSNQALHRN